MRLCFYMLVLQYCRAQVTFHVTSHACELRRHRPWSASARPLQWGATARGLRRLPDNLLGLEGGRRATFLQVDTGSAQHRLNTHQVGREYHISAEGSYVQKQDPSVTFRSRVRRLRSEAGSVGYVVEINILSPHAGRRLPLYRAEWRNYERQRGIRGGCFRCGSW